MRFHNHEFLGGAGIANEHLEHEAVDLGLGQRVGTLSLDGVLGSHDQERTGHLVGLASDGYLPFLHHLQQGALHLGRGAIDLIGQQQVGENRPQGTC